MEKKFIKDEKGDDTTPFDSNCFLTFKPHLVILPSQHKGQNLHDAGDSSRRLLIILEGLGDGLWRGLSHQLPQEGPLLPLQHLLQAAVGPALDVEAVLVAAQLVNVKGGPARAREAGKEPAVIAGYLNSGLAIKNPPEKTQKNPPKKTTKNGF